MTKVVLSVNGGAGSDYTSLINAEAGIISDTIQGENHYIECVNSGTLEDENVTISYVGDGSFSFPNNWDSLPTGLFVTVASGHRHDSTENTGFLWAMTTSTNAQC